MERFLRSLMVAIFATVTFAVGSVRALALPAGYTQVEYLEGDGASYIDTGVFANLNTKAEIKYKPMQSMLNMAMFGARTSKSSNAFTVWASNSNGKVSCNMSSKGAIASTVDLVANQDYVVSLSSSALVVNGTTKSISGATAFTTPSSMYIFNIGGTPASSSGSGNRIFIGRVYYFKVYDNNVLTHDFVPVKYVSNGTTTYGMYDLADPNPATAFRTNQGTGTFTAGPMACPGGTLQTYTTVAAADVPAPVQNGTPTPTNPITPTFYTQGNMVLRRIGDYADSYDATTGKITRRVGVKVFDGTEDWFYNNPSDGVSNYLGSMYNLLIDDIYTEASSVTSNRASPYSTHFARSTNWIGSGGSNRLNKIQAYKPTSAAARLGLGYPNVSDANIPAFKQWLAAQKAAGTPVTVYYSLTESNYYTEDWSAEQCSSPIKIATRAYNTTQFAPVVSALNTAVDTIKNVVTNTINQTAAVSALQSTKQTRPDDGCPQYRQCLLVEDSSGTPHWYEISNAFYNLFAPAIANEVASIHATGRNAVPNIYTQLEYIQSDGTQYIDTGVKGNLQTKVEIEFKFNEYTTDSVGYIFGARDGQNSNAFVIGVSDAKISQSTSKLFAQFDNVAPNSGSNIGVDLQKHKLELSYTGFYVDGIESTTFTNPTNFTTTNNLLLFARYNNGSIAKGALTVYSLKIWDGTKLVRDFVPVKDSNQVVGMYDTISGTFFKDINNEEFVAGPVVSNQTAEWIADFWLNSTVHGFEEYRVYGKSVCNMTTGSTNDVATSAQMADAKWNTHGDNCWCSINKAQETQTNNMALSSEERWVWLTVPDNQTCDARCSENCAIAVGTATNSDFRHAITGI